MESETQQTIHPDQPLQQPPVPIQPPSLNKRLKIILFIALGITVVIGLVIVGFHISNKEVVTQPATVGNPTDSSSYKTDNSTESSNSANSIVDQSQNLAEQSSVSNNTENWKEYVSPRFKFSFRYPQNLILDNQYENKYSDQGGVNIITKERYEAEIAETGVGGGSFIEVWVYSNSQNFSLLEWMKNDTAHSNYSGQTYSSINIDGKTGYIYTVEGMGKGLEAVVTNNDQIYMFADLGFDNELKQLISTFKFNN